MALVAVMMILFFLLPLVIVISKRATTQNWLNTNERMIKTARTLSANAVMDFMRQFSQDQYINHYKMASLLRSDLFYDAGYSKVEIEPDEKNHTILIKAWGLYAEEGSANPKAKKKLTALIHFVSDLLKFGSMINADPFTASSAVYDGGLWCAGRLITNPIGPTLTVRNGPVVVGGDVTKVPPSLDISSSDDIVFEGDFYSRSIGPGRIINDTGSPQLIVWGGKNRYTYVPNIRWPELDLSYYTGRANVEITVNSAIAFDPAGHFTVTPPVPGIPNPIDIPDEGVVILGNDVRLTLSAAPGGVRGRVTVVSVTTSSVNTTPFMDDVPALAAALASRGTIIINGNFRYSSGLNTADDGHAIAVLATNWIVLNQPATSPPGPHLTINGLYFVQRSVDRFNIFAVRSPGGGDPDFKLFGTRCGGFTWPQGGWDAEYTYDRNLLRYSPPGLPERPILVMWRDEAG